MRQSETLTAILPALLKVQEGVGTIKQDSANPFFKSSYASLTQIVEVVKPLLNKNGLFFSQQIVPNEDACVETIIYHAKTGEYISSTMVLKPVKADPQAFGSAVSYAKRYTLAAMLGLVSQAEDDDGNQASNKGNGKAKPSNKQEVKDEFDF